MAEDGRSIAGSAKMCAAFIVAGNIPEVMKNHET